jgi:hypothetical protein
VADSESTKEDKPTKRSVAVKAETQDAGNDDTLTYPVSQLVADGSAILGHESFIVAGALDGSDPDELMVVSDAQAAIDAWLQRPVQVDQREGEEE